MSAPDASRGPQLRWIVFGLGAAAFWFAFFHRVSPSAIAGELARDFQVGGAALGALSATYFYVYAIMQLPTGVLVDTLGPRRVLAAGGLIGGAGALLFGAAESFAVAAAGRTLAGLGVSVAFVSMLKITANWFPERHFSTVAAVGNVIGLSGALAATVPLAWIVTVVPWRGVFAAIGMASIAVALLTWWIARDHAPNAPHAPSPAAASRAQWHHGMWAILCNRATWSAFWVSFGISGSYMCFIGLWAGPLLVTVYGYTPVAASQHTALMILGLAIASGIVGMASDRLRARRPFIIASAVIVLACWIAWFIGVPRAWTYALCTLTGFGVTGFTLCWAVAKEVNPHHHAGMAISLANCGGFLAAGVLQPLVGWVFDLGRAQGVAQAASFRPALAVLIAFAVVGLAGSLFIRETHCRNIWDSEIAPHRK